MSNNIIPALQIEDKKNLSAEEFQKELCAWLESRGLLCELRAYYRSNMIEVLKNTNLGSSLTCTMKQMISPKMHAMNMLISEYFIYSQYHFSVCVFCTEVSLNNMLQNVGSSSQDVSNIKPNFKFTEKEVYDILEAIGILRYNQRAQKIYTSYCELDEPLISYILPTSSLTSVISCDAGEKNSDDINDADCEFILKNINMLLTNSNMLPNEITQMKQYIKLLCEKQHEKHTTLIDTLKTQYKNQLKKYKSKLSEIKDVFDAEKKKFQEEIILTKYELEDMLLQNKMIKKKNDLLDTPKIVNLQEKVQQTEKMISGKSTCDHIVVEEKSTQCVDEKPKRLFKIDKEQQTLTNTSLEAAVLKHVVQQLEKENNNLRMDNFHYCEQIDELANRASMLMSELNHSQQNVLRLNNLLQNSPSIFTTENLPFQYSVPLYGAGEQCSSTVKRPTASTYRHLNRPRKTHNKSFPSSSENSSGSSTPTDELLQEAKRKLRNLELESENMDRRIRTFTESYDFMPCIRQPKNIQSTGNNFKFNDDKRTCKNDVFEFGKFGLIRNSNLAAEPTPHDTLTSLVDETTSNEEFEQARPRKED
ncbi:hypothetical protein Trydic_g7418 [Trypoxylus dichotomus]